MSSSREFGRYFSTHGRESLGFKGCFSSEFSSMMSISDIAKIQFDATADSRDCNAADPERFNMWEELSRLLDLM